jgi:hypothetical protein
MTIWGSRVLLGPLYEGRAMTTSTSPRGRSAPPRGVRGIIGKSNERRGKSTGSNWLKQDDLNADHHPYGLTGYERAELTMLRHEIKRLKIEHQIPSNAAPSLGRSTRFRRSLRIY